MAEDLKKKLHIRNGDRIHFLHLITDFYRTNEEDLLNLKKHEKALKEKMKILKNLDDKST